MRDGIELRFGVADAAGMTAQPRRCAPASRMNAPGVR
jgi:hypothetical protein